MHTIQTVIPTVVRTGTRSTGSTATRHGSIPAGRRALRFLSSWAERRLLGAPEAGRAQAAPSRELPLPWA